MTERLLILAGGVSSRMKKETQIPEILDSKLIEQANTRAKGMIELGNGGKSLIDYLLFNAQRAGFTEVVLLLHPCDTLTQAYYVQQMKNGRVGNMSIYFTRQSFPVSQQKPAGTADAVYQALVQHPSWQQERFVVCNSDNLYSVRALKLLRQSVYPNALISYDWRSLEFSEERIKSFAFIKTDEEGFLENIIEKPTEADAKALSVPPSRLGISMNLFLMDGGTMFPILKATPSHRIRKEKELPTALRLFWKRYGQGFYSIPLAEHVPDLTTNTDLPVVRDYIAKHYQEAF